ncbi:ribosomal protein S5 domain 2-type protein [Lasiosphaeris hirsuta]|uniref:Phosphomevalonate kinase n=1 Tax=Lasiosphaeris hirsuta TaxID=260670 RepID=A0AA40AGT9_9PEZI|nr:ribosomal protein S5 domain 2-type protein [Lasiosphaeris hirsuta]
MADKVVTAVSAPGKMLLAGGYVVLDRAYTGLVFALSARINVLAQEIPTSEGVHLTEIVVESPQFLEAQWRYGYHLAEEDGGIKVTQLQVGTRITANPFVESTLNYVLTYMTRTSKRFHKRILKSARLTILADNDYYSHHTSSPTSSAPSIGTGRFARFPVTLSDAHKTGLGSSAALVTALTAALLTHFLIFDLNSEDGKHLLHNLAQAAHCAAQGKVGSGFDVAAAVYGSCNYRRFSPSVLSKLPEAGKPGFATKLEDVVHGMNGIQWDTMIGKADVGLPQGVAVRMCDVDCGSQTVGMVKKVLAWRAQNPEAAEKLWGELQHFNEALEDILKAGKTEDISKAIRAIRILVKEMGDESDVPIEPDSQTELLDALEEVEGVYGGVVPGAGGYDALALLVKDDEETAQRVEQFLDSWSKEKGGRVSLLGVKGEMEGIRMEDLTVYDGWVR